MPSRDGFINSERSRVDGGLICAIQIIFESKEPRLREGHEMGIAEEREEKYALESDGDRREASHTPNRSILKTDAGKASATKGAVAFKSLNMNRG